VDGGAAKGNRRQASMIREGFAPPGVPVLSAAHWCGAWGGWRAAPLSGRTSSGGGWAVPCP